MDTGLIWILVGLGLLIAEVFLPGVYLLWIGMAAVGTGLLDLAFAPGFATRVVVFLVLLGGGIAMGLAWRRNQRPQVLLNTPESGLVGRTGMLTERGSTGARVRIGDSDWAARLTGDAEPGDKVRVDAVDGTILVVRRVT